MAIWGRCPHCDGGSRVSCTDCECRRCNGSGMIRERCPACCGSSTVRQYCPTCRGSASIACKKCGGQSGFWRRRLWRLFKKRFEPCWWCRGSGQQNCGCRAGEIWLPCSCRRGFVLVPCPSCQAGHVERCSRCGSTGELACPACRGTGAIVSAGGAGTAGALGRLAAKASNKAITMARRSRECGFIILHRAAASFLFGNLPARRNVTEGLARRFPLFQNLHLRDGRKEAGKSGASSPRRRVPQSSGFETAA